MFHVMLALPVLIVIAIIVFVILFGIVAIVSAFIGGTTVAILIKNKTIKKLLFISFCILFLIGFLCLTPVITTYLNLTSTFFVIFLAFVFICIAMLAIAGIKLSNSINNKIGKTLLLIVYCIILIAAISLTIFIFLVSCFFKQ